MHAFRLLLYIANLQSRLINQAVNLYLQIEEYELTGVVVMTVLLLAFDLFFPDGDR
jgi:hypothetical protein